MGKCQALTTGRFPFFPLRPCGHCEDGWARLSAASGQQAGQRLDHLLLLLQLSHCHAPGLSMEPFHWDLCSLLPGKKGGDTRERDVTQKSRLRLKRPIVFLVWSRGVESQVQRSRRHLFEWGQGRSRGTLGTASSFGCRELPGLELHVGISSLCSSQRRSLYLLSLEWGLVWEEHFKRLTFPVRVYLAALFMIEKKKLEKTWTLAQNRIDR